MQNLYANSPKFRRFASLNYLKKHFATALKWRVILNLCAFVKNVAQSQRDIKRKIRTEFSPISRFKFLARTNIKSLLNGKFSR